MCSKIFAFLLFSVFFTLTHCQEKCTKVGTTCSSDCSRIVACTQVGSPPILNMTECNPGSGNPPEPSYCQEIEGKASCGGKNCKGGVDSIKVICGSEGRFPHPTNPSATVRCSESNKPPSKICYCPIDNPNVDVKLAALPCSKATAHKPVTCGSSFSFGDFPDSSAFSYVCKSSSEIILTLKETQSRRRRSSESSFLSLITRATVDCEDEPSGDQSEEPPTESPTDSPTDPGEPTSSPTEAPPVIKCIRQWEAIPDPTDCYHYYFCGEDFQPQRRQCRSGRFFFKQTKSCVPGKC